MTADLKPSSGLMSLMHAWHSVERHAGRRAACVALAAMDIVELYRAIHAGAVTVDLQS